MAANIFKRIFGKKDKVKVVDFPAQEESAQEEQWGNTRVKVRINENPAPELETPPRMKVVPVPTIKPQAIQVREEESLFKTIADLEKPASQDAAPKPPRQTITLDVEVSTEPKKVDKPAVDSDMIAARAWEIWQREGCPEGRDREHWLQAEKELIA